MTPRTATHLGRDDNGPVRVLVVAPEYADGLNAKLDVNPEIERIGRRVTVVMLRDNVTYGTLYDLCRYERFHAIHWVCHAIPDEHGDYNRLLLESKQLAPEQVETLRKTGRVGVATPPVEYNFIRMEQIAQLYGLCEAEFGFFNTCNSSLIATYCVLHGLQGAVYTNVNLVDSRAWEMPASFYEAIYRQQDDDLSVDYRAAFYSAIQANRDGTYGWISDLSQMAGVSLRHVLEDLALLHEKYGSITDDRLGLRNSVEGLAAEVAKIAKEVSGVKDHLMALGGRTEQMEAMIMTVRNELGALDLRMEGIGDRLEKVEARETVYPLERNLLNILLISGVATVAAIVGSLVAQLILGGG